MLDLFGNFQEHQEKLQKKLAEIIIEHQSGDGAIVIEMDGNRRIRDVRIDPDHFNPVDWDKLSDLLVIAINEATEKAEVKAAAETQKLMNDMMPGLGGLFGS